MRAGLVEQQDLALGRAVPARPPPFTTTPRRAARDRPETMATGAARMSGHGVATTRTATARSSSPDSAHATPASARLTPRNTHGVAVGEPHERRARRFGFRDQPDDAGVGALRPRRRGPQVERSAGVHAPASDRVPDARSTGNGSPVSALSSRTAASARGVRRPGRPRLAGRAAGRRARRPRWPAIVSSPSS